MARKRENVFIARVHSHLPEHIHAQKNHNPFRAGEADCYYEAYRRILWAEYKWMDKLPALIVADEIPHFTRLQQQWLRRVYSNGHPVALIIGFKDGVLIKSGVSWAMPFKPEPFTFDEAIEWLIRRLTVEPTTLKTRSPSISKISLQLSTP